jgi:hypothetical protein
MAWLWPHRARPVRLEAPKQPARSAPVSAQGRVLQYLALQAQGSVSSPTGSCAAATRVQPCRRVPPRSCPLACTCAYRPLYPLRGAAPPNDFRSAAPPNDSRGGGCIRPCSMLVIPEERATVLAKAGAGERDESRMKRFTPYARALKISLPGVARRGRVILPTTFSALSLESKAALQRKSQLQRTEESVALAPVPRTPRSCRVSPRLPGGVAGSVRAEVRV